MGMGKAMRAQMKADKATAQMLLNLGQFSLSAKELGHAAGSAVDVLRDALKQEVPVRSGRLRAAIFARVNKTGTATVGISHRAAPHAHLVEYGTRWRQWRSAPEGRHIMLRGRLVFARSPGMARPNAFFTRIIRRAASAARGALYADLARWLERRMAGKGQTA